MLQFSEWSSSWRRDGESFKGEFPRQTREARSYNEAGDAGLLQWNINFIRKIIWKFKNYELYKFIFVVLSQHFFFRTQIRLKEISNTWSTFWKMAFSTFQRAKNKCHGWLTSPDIRWPQTSLSKWRATSSTFCKAITPRGLLWCSSTTRRGFFRHSIRFDHFLYHRLTKLFIFPLYLFSLLTFFMWFLFSIGCEILFGSKNSAKGEICLPEKQRQHWAHEDFLWHW